ncbi:MAG: hypothetical protein GQ559_11600 [Desulfobulbaceae bacterium]|nr:hypothetical protein [Desulfobulbaceae bacterium]
MSYILKIILHLVLLTAMKQIITLFAFTLPANIPSTLAAEQLTDYRNDPASW